jgi:serine/threonine-protein kinase
VGSECTAFDGVLSMRQRTPEGSQIYAVYLGPFPDQATACSVRAGIGGGADAKRMDNATPAEQLWQC